MPVDFRKWVKKSSQRVQDDPKMGILRSAYYGYVSVLLTASKYRTWGTNIYERDWDLLVILDACRVDAMKAVADEYSYIDHIDSIRSVGSTSAEWLPLTFQRKYEMEIKRTAYVSGNPYITPIFREKKEPPMNQPIQEICAHVESISAC